MKMRNALLALFLGFVITGCGKAAEPTEQIEDDMEELYSPNQHDIEPVTVTLNDGREIECFLYKTGLLCPGHGQIG